MDIVDAVKSRKSIRGFKPDPIPQGILKEILEIAVRAPSGMNTQCWEIIVLTGEVLDRLRKANVDKVTSGIMPAPGLKPPQYDGAYRQRQVELGISLFQLMGIEREDKEKRAAWAERGFRFFDAPAAIILSYDTSLEGASPCLDIGIIAQTICLTALNYGLGTCIAGQGISYPDEVREITGIPESKLMPISISIGYPDMDFPANKLESKREPIENTVTWFGFS